MDVQGLFDDTLNVVVEYTYDRWGNILSVTGSKAATVGKANPFRYRGYYYDEESGLYYLQSRYYDPATGRFLNADKYISTGLGVIHTNMYSYCKNNPVNYWDPTGCFFKEIGDFFKGIGAAIADFINDFNNDYRSPTLALGASDVPYIGKPGSHVTSPDGTKERIYGPDGRPDRDRHHTDHGSPKHHPVPHDHDWEEKPNGKWEPGKPYPSPEGPLQPRDPAPTPDPPTVEFRFPNLAWLNPPTGDDSFSGHVRDFLDSFVIDYTR